MKNILLSVISGLLLTLCFPKFGISILVWIALVPFFVSIYSSKNIKQALFYAFIFGMCYFGGVLFWVSLISRWVGGFGYVAWVLLSIYQTFYIMLFAYAAFLSMNSFHKSTNMLLIPFLWAAVEWLRCFGEFAVPGALLGLTQYRNLPIIQIANVFGVFGVSFIIVIVNYVIFLAVISEGSFIERFIKLWPKIAFVSVLVVAVYAKGIDVLNETNYDPFEREIKIAVIQPDIGQEEKLNPRNTYDMLNLLDFMSRSSFMEAPDIIIWPETAVMTFIEKDAAALSKLKDITKKGRCYLVTGGFYSKDGKIFNSVFSLSPDGKIISRYDKEHLVPFGEYLPFKWMIYPFLRSTGYFETDQYGGKDPGPLSIGSLKAGCMVCFESLFDGLGRQRSKGTHFLLTVTNDAWFGQSAAAEQHIMAAPFRAIENRKYLVQAANTGISAFVDPCGRFIKRSELEERRVLILNLPLSSGVR
ncbi:MAG: apolipoprotein N-acyltransferase [Candidatus Saganbacteria bacterium]|nr:apolipoprotein N-acyltransferase [Candidatus Saganbacteria bacterium]